MRNLNLSGDDSQLGLVDQETGELDWSSITLDQSGEQHPKTENENGAPPSKFLLPQASVIAPPSPSIP